MSKLVIFGDSFVSLKVEWDLSWINLIADSLNIPRSDILNYGQPGTSVEFSVEMLTNYINSKNYNENDVIIFVTSSTNRPPILQGNNPEMASQFSSFLSGEKRFLKTSAAEYYKKHEAFYKTWFEMNTSSKVATERLMLALALKGLPNLTVMMSAFDEVLPSKHPLLLDADNFIRIESNLISISHGEYIGKINFFDFYSYFNSEYRACHLSNTNNRILAVQVARCIKEKNGSLFNKKLFKSNLYGLGEKYNDVYLKEFTSYFKIK